MRLRGNRDRDRAGGSGLVAAHRFLWSLLAAMLALLWPLALWQAVAFRDWALVFMPLGITAAAGSQVALMRKAHGVRREAPAQVAAPYPREPRDKDRPCLFCRTQARTDDPRTVTCPVCGMEDPLNLDGDFLGWPAHSECAEFAGPWKPSRQFGDEDARVLADALRGGLVTEQQARERLAAVWGAAAGGKVPDAVRDLSGGFRSGIGEVREQVIRAHAVPPPQLAVPVVPAARTCPECGTRFAATSAEDAETALRGHRGGRECAQRKMLRKQAEVLDAIASQVTGTALRKTPPEPVFREFCTCGYEVTGTALQNARALKAHHLSGACPHSPQRS